MSGKKIILEIPEEYVSHFQRDRFRESLERLSADAHCLAGRYEKETAQMLVAAFIDAIEV